MWENPLEDIQNMQEKIKQESGIIEQFLNSFPEERVVLEFSYAGVSYKWIKNFVTKRLYLVHA
jgi:hypothetical protein